MSETTTMVATRDILNPAVHCAYDKMVAPGELQPHPSNPNKHGASQIDHFIAILKYNGWRRPITVSRLSGFITRGHGALMAAVAAGFTEVPVDYQDYLSTDSELADLVADNQLQRMSEMDTSKLTEIMVHLRDAEEFDLTLTGFEQKKIDKLLTVFDDRNPDRQSVAGSGEQMSSVNVSGGETSSTTTDEGAASATAVHLVNLFFDELGLKRFIMYAEFFQKELGLATMSDGVLEVLRQSFVAHDQVEGEET